MKTLFKLLLAGSAFMIAFIASADKVSAQPKSSYNDYFICHPPMEYPCNVSTDGVGRYGHWE